MMKHGKKITTQKATGIKDGCQMNHDIMIGELADKFIDAGYQVRKNLEYSFNRYKGEIDLLALDLESKVAIAIEVKTHHRPKGYLKAISQLYKSEKALKSLLEIKLDKVYKVYHSNEIQEVII